MEFRRWRKISSQTASNGGSLLFTNGTTYIQQNAVNALQVSQTNVTFAPTVQLLTVASTTSQAGFNVPQGTAPTTPNNGDVWMTSSGLILSVQLNDARAFVGQENTMIDKVLNWLFVAIFVGGWLLIIAYASGAFAMDWSQPILDEKGAPVPDCPVDPKTNQIEACGKIVTLGSLASRALLSIDQQRQPTPEEKALAGNIAIRLMTHPEAVPDKGNKVDEMKTIRDAIGRLSSPLAVARGFALLDDAVK